MPKIGDENPIRTLGDYSKPSHEGYRNTIELLAGNNVVPLRSDTIRLVQNGCSFHGLWFEDPNQHLKDFLKLVESLDLDNENRERRRLRLFQFSLRDQASNWLERLPAGSISLWEDLTTRFLSQFFPPGRTAKLSNDILMFQQHHGESLFEAWTLDYTVGGRLRKISAKKAWATIEELAQYEEDGWNDPVALGEGSLDYENPNIEQLLGVIEYKVDTLMKEAISLMGRSKSVFEMTSNTVLYLMRRNLEVLRKFYWTILGGRFNQLSHVSSPLLSKPGEYFILQKAVEVTTLRLKRDLFTLRIVPRLWPSGPSSALNVFRRETICFGIYIILVNSREEGTEFEVTGFDKAFVSLTLGKTVELGRGVTSDTVCG
ncbi:zinc finger, CCHC-type containing protein [Tanacetum coccineum]